jgi:hypothetical protein
MLNMDIIRIAAEMQALIDELRNMSYNDISSIDTFAAQNEKAPAEMLTIKECVKAVHGVSENSIRQIVAQGKVKSVRAGEGKNGKILVNKADLLAYFGS